MGLNGHEDRSDGRPARARFGPLLTACAAVVISAFVVRALAVAEPLGIDQGLWASGARALSLGQVLYRDVWDQKPPAIFLTYLSAFTILGWKASAVVWLDLVASALTSCCVYGIGRALGGRATGAVAAALFAALTMPAWLYGNGGFLERSVNETFISLLASAGAWCAVRSRMSSRGAWLAGFGFALGCAVLYKPNAGIYAIVLPAWLACTPNSRGRAGLRAPRAWLLVVAGASVAPLLMGLWLWRQGLLGEAWVATLAYNLQYVNGDAPAGTSHGLAYAHAIWLRLKTDPLWAAGGLGAAAALATAVRDGRLDPLPALAILWGAGTAIAIYANGVWLFNSYFIPALPPLALIAAWLLAGISAGGRFRPAAASLGIVVIAALVVGRGYVARVGASAALDLGALRGTIDRVQYLDAFGGYGNGRGYSARANDELETFLRAHTKPGDPIYVFGISGDEAYFGADRPVGQRFLRVNFFLAGVYPDPRFTLDAVLADLARSRPVYVVFEALHTDTPLGAATDGLTNRADVRRFLASYAFEQRIEDFSLYRRRD